MAAAWLAVGAPAALACPDTAGEGARTEAGLLLETDGGGFAPAPLVGTEAYLWVTGMIVRAQVTQEFYNPTEEAREAVYLFPLPETAAVDHLFFRVGNRVIEGRIRERTEARRSYEAARQRGDRASLLEQQRPNVFRTSVANVGPGESVEVVIEYQDTVRWDAGEFRVRFPSVVAPRYVPPGDPEAVAEAIETCTEEAAGRSVASDRFRLVVELDAGFPLRSLFSPSHAVRSVPLDGTAQLVRLDDGENDPARDFVLVWSPEVGRTPRAALFTEEDESGVYALLMLMPADSAAPADATPAREVVFVLDTSGSMAGPSLEQAKLALQLALDRLRPADRFNVIAFDSNTRLLFPSGVAAERTRVEEAEAWVGSLSADGGTEMAPALEAALAGGDTRDGIRQVIFVTDGAVANEAGLFAQIERDLGHSRLFTVGIGSAPNTFFMRKVASFGRGTFTYIGSVADVSERMEALFRKIESPALTDVEIEWPAAEAEVWPARVPDLYGGEPVVVAARLTGADPGVAIHGRRGSRSWDVLVDAGEPRAEAGIRVLWARRKIEALMDSLVEGADRHSVRDEVVRLGLEHHLVTRYTSLVAVDVTQGAATSDTGAAGVRGGLPRSASAAPLYALLALLSSGAAVLLETAARWAKRRRG